MRKSEMMTSKGPSFFSMPKASWALSAVTILYLARICRFSAESMLGSSSTQSILGKSVLAVIVLAIIKYPHLRFQCFIDNMNPILPAACGRHEPDPNHPGGDEGWSVLPE